MKRTDREHVKFDTRKGPREKKEPIANFSVDEIGKNRHIAPAREAPTKATMKTATTTRPTPAPIPAEYALKPGDEITVTTHTDAKACYVERVSRNGRTAVIRHAKQTLLNGPTSGEPDALVSTTGGFCAHVEGTQRWAVEYDPAGFTERITLRQRGNGAVWKRTGSATTSPGNFARKGHRPYYDFNF